MSFSEVNLGVVEGEGVFKETMIQSFILRFTLAQRDLEGEGEYGYHNVNISPQPRGSSDGLVSIQRIKTEFNPHCYHNG